MGWGGGHGDRPPRYVKPVVQAWRENRTMEISKGKGSEGVATREGGYYVYGNLIAVHRTEAQRLDNVTRVIRGAEDVDCAEYAYTFANWPTKMTARHLSALGIKAECFGVKDPKCYMNGKLVDASQWYSLEEIVELVNPPPKPKRVPREPIFVNLTRDLFEVEYA